MATVVTALISDLHLGTRTKADLLARPELRRRLLAELEGVDQLVLLGDSIELRDGPLEDALAAATPFFEDLGAVMAGRRVAVVAGNHDYQLAAPWLARRRAGGGVRPLRLEQVSAPARDDPLGRLALRMSGTELVLAYPGVWVRSDVYAIHGHYLDCHNHVPTFECLASAISERLIRAREDGFQAPDDYEAVLAPLYGLLFRVAQSRRIANAGKALVREWERLGGYRGPQGGARRALGRLVVPAALKVLDLVGLGAFRHDSSPTDLRRPGLAAMAEVADRLRIEADYLLFGHLHRPGPLDGDAQGWKTGSGTRLMNTGSWVYEPAYLGAAPTDSPYWPGSCVFLRDDGPPELRHLLRDLSHEELRGGR
jgi:predicted phosphodiesterase